MAETAKIAVKASRAAGGRARVSGGARAVDQLRTEVDRLLNDFLRGYWHVPFRSSVLDVEPYWRGKIGFGATPAVDIIEKDDDYKLTAELPGVEAQNVDIKFRDGTLTLKAQKEEDEEDQEHAHFLSERRYGAFHRSFRVPDAVDADKIEASFKSGVLTVILPKTAEARTREKKIAIDSA